MQARQLHLTILWQLALVPTVSLTAQVVERPILAPRNTPVTLYAIKATLPETALNFPQPIPNLSLPGEMPNIGDLASTSVEAPVVANEDLPNEPGWTLPPPPPPLRPCPSHNNRHQPDASTPASHAGSFSQPCLQINPYHRFLDATTAVPLTRNQKAYLAFHNFKDPGNLITIFGTAAFTVGTDPHTAYGPGWNGFLRNSGYSFSQDATGEFFGTFLIPSLLHEDPHYHRDPHSTIPRRLLHAVSRTVIAQHDDGSLMPNYAVLLTYPISAEISNLYVPGVHGDGPSTAERIATGLATDPINNLITEFLPDVAKRINIRVVFVQRVLNMVTANAASGGFSGGNP